MQVKSLLTRSITGISLILLAINVYGLFQNIRPDNLDNADLRFENDAPISFSKVMDKLSNLPEGTQDTLSELPKLVSTALAHIHWNEEPDPTKFNQLIPIWENYILFLMGKFSGIPEYKKYHFTHYKRSLERGIGLCGDASMVSSQILDKRSIPNQIVSFATHVVVAAKTENNQEVTLDPDYGVFIPHTIADIANNPAIVTPYYAQAGYSEREAVGVQSVFIGEYQRWDGVQHFVTKKYYFESLSYIAKWAIPLLGLGLAFLLGRKA